MNENKILIATPVNNREKLLPYFLKHLDSIDFNKEDIHLYFLVNNSQDNSKKILFNFMKEHLNEYASIKVETMKTKYKFQDERTTTIRNQYTYRHLSEIRNAALNYAKKLNVDYLLSVDSDILVPSNIIDKLLSANRPIVSSLIYNGYLVEPNSPWKYTNIMRFNGGNIEHISNWYTKNAEILTESKLTSVDVTGAVSLISRDVIVGDVRYGYHPKGEDVYFSLDAKSKGFDSFCDLSCFSQHIMCEKQLENITL